MFNNPLGQQIIRAKVSVNFNEVANRSMHILYLHGFSSSAKSAKAQALKQYFASTSSNIDYQVPTLSYDPNKSLDAINNCIKKDTRLIIGSSMGAYYAAHIANQYQIKTVLINPVVTLQGIKQHFLGKQRNPYTGEEYSITEDTLSELESLEITKPFSNNAFFLITQTADEVLNYRVAVEKYLASPCWIEAGGSHRFENFAAAMPSILAFSRF